MLRFWIRKYRSFVLQAIFSRKIRPLTRSISLWENCPNTEFFLLCIFLYSDWNIFSPNKRKKRTRKNSVFGHFHAVFAMVETLKNWWTTGKCFVISLHKKWSFPLRISSDFYGFGHIYWRNLCWKSSFFVQGMVSKKLN